MSQPLLSALAKTGYETPTKIQEAAIPPALAGRDVLGCAQTGTGKTAAFSLPLLQRIDAVAGKNTKLRALVLTPTRELAAQIGESITTYGESLEVWHTVIFGGVSDKAQIDELKRGVDILVATPGRLLDLMNRGFVSLSDIEFFILDEADRMLDMGFIHDVKKVVAKLPKEKQTLFFSATMPPEIKKLADGLLRNPVHVSVTPVSSTAERIEQKLYFVDKGFKKKLLVDVLKDPTCERTIVFSRTKHGANRVAEDLLKAGISAAAIHGNKSQGARTRALDGFKTGSVRALVATDIAARGIDVDGVTHVINYDIPNVPETYVHRIGRTARAGREGIALSFCDTEERPFVRDIEKLIGLAIPRVAGHAYEGLVAKPSEGSESRDSGGRSHPPRGARPGRPHAAAAKSGPSGGGGSDRGRPPGGRPNAARPSGGRPSGSGPQGARPAGGRSQGPSQRGR